MAPVAPLDPMKPDPRRGAAPQSERMVSQSEQVGTTKSSPVLIRIFKATKELEFWRKSSDGDYRLVATFRVCSNSGALGPKLRQGDRQSPEGFYTIGPGQLNSQSVAFLSLNTGYPNAFDRAHGRTGGDIMIHGGCSSSGCFAIEDGPSQEVYTAVRDALAGGQREVQVHIFPYRMTQFNVMAYPDPKNKEFWAQLQTGYDIFERDHKDLVVNVIRGKYVIF